MMGFQSNPFDDVVQFSHSAQCPPLCTLDFHPTHLLFLIDGPLHSLFFSLLFIYTSLQFLRLICKKQFPHHSILYMPKTSQSTFLGIKSNTALLSNASI